MHVILTPKLSIVTLRSRALAIVVLYIDQAEMKEAIEFSISEEFEVSIWVKRAVPFTL